MLRHVANRASFAGLSLFLMLIGAWLLFFFLSQVPVNVLAEEDSSTMSDLLVRISDEEVTFQFTVPLIADQRFWTVPDGLNDGSDDETTIQINEIGQNYICFRVRSGQAIDVICTPFTNIASVSYLDMPE